MKVKWLSDVSDPMDCGSDEPSNTTSKYVIKFNICRRRNKNIQNYDRRLKILLLVIDRKRKTKDDIMVIEDLTNMINKFYRTDICKTLQYKSVEYMFFQARTEHLRYHLPELKSHLSRFQRTEIKIKGPYFF